MSRPKPPGVRTQIRDYVASRHGAALGGRLRRLSERIDREAAEVYEELGIKFEQRWFGTLNQLDLNGALRVGDLAATLCISHAAVSQVRAQLVRAGYVADETDPSDARATKLSLTPLGRRLIDKLRPLWAAMDTASKRLNEEAGDAAAAVARVEAALDKISLADRIRSALRRSGSRRDEKPR